MKSFIIFVFLINFCIITKSQTPSPMPDFVLYAAQHINDNYGLTVDVNNVIWDYTEYLRNSFDPDDLCPISAEASPQYPQGGDAFYIIEFQPILDGTWGHEIWRYLVYVNSGQAVLQRHHNNRGQNYLSQT